MSDLNWRGCKNNLKRYKKDVVFILMRLRYKRDQDYSYTVARFYPKEGKAYHDNGTIEFNDLNNWEFAEIPEGAILSAPMNGQMISDCLTSHGWGK